MDSAPPTERPACLSCDGTKVRQSVGGPVPCDHCRPDGTQRGVTDPTPEEERIEQLRAQLADSVPAAEYQRALAQVDAVRREIAAIVAELPKLNDTERFTPASEVRRLVQQLRAERDDAVRLRARVEQLESQLRARAAS